MEIFHIDSTQSNAQEYIRVQLLPNHYFPLHSMMHRYAYIIHISFIIMADNNSAMHIQQYIHTVPARWLLPRPQLGFFGGGGGVSPASSLVASFIVVVRSTAATAVKGGSAPTTLLGLYKLVVQGAHMWSVLSIAAYIHTTNAADTNSYCTWMCTLHSKASEMTNGTMRHIHLQYIIIVIGTDSERRRWVVW